MNRRNVLAACVGSGLLSIAGCIGSLEDITEQGDEDDSANDGDDSYSNNDGDDEEPLNEVHEQILSYEAETESVTYSAEMKSGLTSCRNGRRVFSPPAEEENELSSRHCAESAEEEGIALTEIDSWGFRDLFDVYGAIITSPEVGNEIEEAHFSDAQIDLIQAADFAEDTLIIFQARTSSSGVELQIENIGELPDEDASFLSATLAIGDATEPNFLNGVIHVEGHTLSDDLIIGLQEYDGDPLPDEINEDYIQSHSIWKT